ncbi:glycosyltransferase family 2 protein [Geobacillus thermocatenulatus]|uniref:glycosyltransferase family 2 protein n=1 Tax=Geobacillus thermocatenulatus TaxID=33938 RepID=UPI003D219457
MDKKIAAVVVTYNRKNDLKKNLKCLKKQTRKIDRIFIIDNASTDGTEDFIRNEINDPNITYIKLDTNIGGSGGFYTGVKVAYEAGYDYIWGMDDDAFPDEEALNQIMKVIDLKRELACYWSNCNDDREFNNHVKEVKFWMFVGFFIPREIIDEVGFPRSDFFIYHDDSEYSIRIRRHGYKIYKVRDSKIIHRSFEERDKYSKKIFGKELSLAKLSDWKLYYLVRNSILMYKWSEKGKYNMMLKVLPKLFFKLLIFNKKQINIFVRAYIDGVMNRAGIVLRP